MYADLDEATRLALRGGFGNNLLRTLVKYGDSLNLHDFAKLGRDPQGFITTRAGFLAEREREFMISMAVQPPERLTGEADIDTE